MRLINTGTIKPEVFSSDDTVKYAILSHRWEDEEVTLQEVVAGNVESKKGYQKVWRACAEAARAGLQYIWIDTCCIDKSSSAELSEAINSMYRWYERAQVCYAYLSDVDSAQDLESSAWFTRGWTLQELVAPRNMKFYDRSWRSFGTKSGLQSRISKITNIPLLVLRDCNPSACSVAQRMSWASDRVTTRPEDSAYCLMGLFDVNMPMLYGEGMKAFVRLQEEIIKISDDQSIFAWSDTSGGGHKAILAPSPSCFKGCSELISTAGSVEPEQYSMTNVGLSIRLPLMPWAMNIYIAILQCRDKRNDRELMPSARGLAQNQRTGILLKRTALEKQYFRVTLADRDVFEIDTLKYAAELVVAPILILQRIVKVDNRNKLYGLLFRNLTVAWFWAEPPGAPRSPCRVVARRPGQKISWSNDIYSQDELYHMKLRGMQNSVPIWVYEMPHGKQGLLVSFQRERQYKARKNYEGRLASDEVGIINVGFDFDFNPVCVLYHIESPHWREHFSSKPKVDNAKEDDIQYDLGNCQTLREEIEQYRNCGVTNDWSQKGVCVLVGDRRQGISARLPALNLLIDIHESWQDRSTKAWMIDIGAIELPSAVPSG